MLGPLYISKTNKGRKLKFGVLLGIYYMCKFFC